jgi:hypothetical protein
MNTCFDGLCMEFVAPITSVAHAYVQTDPLVAIMIGVRAAARRLSFNICSEINNLSCRKNQTFFMTPAASLKSRHEVVIAINIL